MNKLSAPSFTQWLLPNSLTKSIQYYRALRYIAFLLVSVLLAQGGVTSTNIGYYELLLHLTYSLSFFWVSGLFQAVLIQAGTSNSSSEVKDKLSLAWSLSVVISLIVVSGLILLSDRAVPFITGLANIPLWPWYIAAVGTSLLPIAYEFILMAREQGQKLLLWGILSFGGHIIASLGPLLLGYGLLGLLQAQVVLNVIRLLVMWFDLGIPHLAFSFRYFPKGSMWLIGYGIIGGFPLAFDTWLIGFEYQSESQIAIFRYGARELPLIMILLGGIHLGMLRRFYKEENVLSSLRSQVKRSMHILGPISIVLLCISPYLFPLVFTRSFAESAWIFNVYLFVLCARWIMNHTIVMAKEAYSLLLWVSVLEMFVNILLSLLFIQWWGMMGVVWATVIAYTLEKICYGIWLWRSHGIRPAAYLPIRWYAFYSMLISLSFGLSYIWWH